MTTAQIDDCFLHDKDRLSHGEAIAILSDRVRPCVSIEDVPVGDAVGRICAGDIVSAHPVPGHRNAAVDGYAFAYCDYDSAGGRELRLAGRATAGHPVTDPLPAGSAIRIFTGAPVPNAYDTVAMQEDVSIGDEGADRGVRIPSGLKKGANLRDAGEDLSRGDVIVRCGHGLRPQDLAALTSAGYTSVPCYRRPRVAMFSTGDEVVRPGQPLAFGQVYDANGPMLRALVLSSGATFDDLGILPDDASVVVEKISDAAARFDLVLTSGGASLGEEDHIVSTLDAIGRRHLWQIAVKPGRPMMFGQVGTSVFLGLPGNPVAVFVCFLLYAKPLIARLGGALWKEPPRFSVPAAFEIPRKKPDRREFLRGSLVAGKSGLEVEKFPRDGSGLITSLREADGLIEIAEDVLEVRRGQPVDFIPFSAFGLC